MDQILEFFTRLLDSSDWPPRWHCGRWTEFHGWLYIISDLMIWSAYFSIPLIIIRYISKKHEVRFVRLYFLFAAFILACGATHFLDAVAFWIPVYRLSALVRFITGILSWTTVFYLVKLLPAVFSLKSHKELEIEILQRKKAEELAMHNEERVQSIFKAAPDAVIVIDHRGIIVNWNTMSETIFGWAVEEVLGKQLSEVIIPLRYREAHQKGLHHFLQTGKGPVLGKAIEIQAITKKNIEFDVSLSISPVNVEEKPHFIGFVRDITELKQAEKKIKESEQIFSTLFYKSPIMKSIAEASTGRYIDMNEAMAGFFGYPKNEIIGKTSVELNMMSNIGLREKIMTNIREKGYVRDIETEIISKNGDSRWVSTNIDMINLNGKDCFMTAAIDITKRKEAERSLARLNEELEQKVKERTEKIFQNERRFRTLIENSNEVIIISDMLGNRLFVSEGIKRMLGYTPEEFMQFSIFTMVPEEEVQSVHSILQKVIEYPHQPFTINVRIQHKNGAWRWVEAVIAGFPDVPGLNGVVINYRDVTERKEAEENLKATLKEISDYKFALDESSIVAITDQKGIIKHVNDNFCHISKYKREELIGQDHRIINSGYHSKTFIKNLWVTIANGKIWRGELKNKAKDGAFYWVDTTIVPFLNETGKPYQYVAIRADITDKKKAEKEVKQLNEELEQKVMIRTSELEAANKEMEAFSYSVSHDLRSPLRGILGFATILEEDYAGGLDDEARRIISVIKNNTVRMGQLIDDLLAFSRLGKKDIIKTTINTGEMVTQILKNLDASESDYEIEWAIQSLPSLKGDLQTIRQVWVNLIANAIKYSRNKKPPQIEIGTFIHEGQTAFFVKDNGVGFDIKYSDKLFKVFQRLHSNEEFEGTGVGLAIIEKIISKHGGKVWAEGEVNKGASFYFSLPS